MGLVAIGISHKTASVEARERFSYTRNQVKEFHNMLNDTDSITNAIILSTCNRMEIYACSPCNEACMEKIMDFLTEEFNVNENDIKNYFYTLEDGQAIRHIFRVASGLDSQVLGEREILGQVKSAWLMNNESIRADNFLNIIFKKAVDIGVAVRRDTGISHGNVSIGSVAIKMLKERFKTLRDKTVLIIGAGKIAGLMSRYIKDEGIKGFFVSNRTYAKACELAKECGGEAVNFDQMQEKLKTTDIVISSTASPHIILKKKDIKRIMDARRNPLLLLDLSVPRDIDPEVRYLSDVSLCDLDNLKYVIEKNYNERKKEALRVEKIIESELENTRTHYLIH